MPHEQPHTTSPYHANKEAEILFNQAPSAMAYVDQEGQVIKCNKRFIELFGYTHEDIPTLDHWYEKVYPDPSYRKWVMNIWEQDLQDATALDGNVKGREYTIQAKDGTKHSVIVSGSIIINSGFIAHFVDLTDLKKIESKLKESEIRWNLVLEGNGDGIWDWLIQDDTVYFSTPWKSMLGYDANKLQSKTQLFFDLLHPDDQQRVGEMLQKHWSDPEKYPYSCEIRMRCSDGSYKWIMSRGKAILDDEGKPYRMVGTHIDISQEIEYRQKLQESQKELQLIFDNAVVGLMYITGERKLIKANKHLADMFGYDSPQEMVGMSMRQFHISQERFEEYGKLNFEPLRMGKLDNIQYQLRKKDGSAIWCELSGKTIDNHIPANMSQGVLWVLKDISLQKKQQEEFETIFNTSRDGLAILDMESNFIKFNRAYQEMLGYSKEELLSKSCIGLSTPDDIPKAYAALSEVIEKGYKENFEKSCITKNGDIINIVMSASMMPDQQHILINTKDMTQEIKNMQEEHEKLQKLIDTQDSIVVLTTGEKLAYINKKFLTFFGYKNLDEFLQDYTCICERFVEESDFFHLGKIQNNEKSWIESLLNLSGRSRIVLMHDVEDKPHIFSIFINNYDEELYIVSFSDISDTMTQQFQLKRQATIDSLTGLYNRLYFKQNIKHLITKHTLEEFETGVIFFDIDHFKRVNDTYGHDIGDKVLQTTATLVKRYIRNDDRLIRWGGEEFIILVESESIERVVKQAQHLRSVIKHHSFKKVGHLTCSFGCALHCRDEDIMQTIKRADQALYQAKENGRNRVEVSNTLLTP